MPELLRGGVTTVMEIGGHGEYVVERAAHYGLRVYMGQAFRSGRWLTRDGKRVEWEWNEERGPRGTAARGGVPRPPRRRPRRPRPLLLRAGPDRHLHPGPAPGGASASPTRRGCRTRCTPRSRWWSSTRWWPATARRRSRGCRSWACSAPTPSWATPSSSAAPRGRTTRRATWPIMADSGCSVAHAVWVFARRGVPMESFARYRAAGRQHVARHRHQPPERDRGDALGRGLLEDGGAQHRGHHRRARLRRGHPRRGARARPRRPRAASPPAPRPTSCCGRRPRGG